MVVYAEDTEYKDTVLSSKFWEIESSYYKTDFLTLKSVLEKDKSVLVSKELALMIDPAMIYQSAMTIGNFMKSLSLKSEIDLYTGYQLSFYIQELRCLETPEYFLTNKEEILVTKRFYDKWKMSEQIRVSVSLGEQSIKIFDFICRNNELNKVDYTSLCMGYLSFVLLVEPLEEFVNTHVVLGMDVSIWFTMLTFVVTVGFAFKLLMGTVRVILSKRLFKKKTRTIVETQKVKE